MIKQSMHLAAAFLVAASPMLASGSAGADDGAMRTTQFWWPEQLNLGILHQQPPTSSPMGLFEASDGVFNLGASGEGNWVRLCKLVGRLDWLTDDDLDVYAAAFTRTGFTGGLNWYRNMDRNWASTAQVPAPTIAVPSLFIGGRDDAVLGFTRTDRAREVVTGPYREEWLDGAGHWIPQEQSAEVNRILLEFLAFCGW